MNKRKEKLSNILIISLIIILIIVLVCGLIKNKRLEEQNKADAVAYNQEQILEKESKEKELENNDTEFLKNLKANNISKIKLIGDSITAGYFSTGYELPASNPLIITDSDGNSYHEASYTCYSWANDFRDYLNKNFPSVKFYNYGIEGKSAKWFNNYKNKVISDEDIVFVMLGTNDRWHCKTVDEYKTNLEQLLDYINSNSKEMIVLTPPPTELELNKNEKQPDNFNFTIKDVVNTINLVCKEKGYETINIYSEFMKQVSLDNPSELLQKGGNHPNDKGYDVIWNILEKNLGLRTITQ